MDGKVKNKEKKHTQKRRMLRTGLDWMHRPQYQYSVGGQGSDG
jgi:hypothetical protein